MSCGVDYPENSENHNSEETFLKSVFHNGDDFIRGYNYVTLTPVANMTYPSSPPLDKDGNIQCAQEGDARRHAGRRDSTVNFQVECVVIDLLDRELIGLPKDFIFVNYSQLQTHQPKSYQTIALSCLNKQKAASLKIRQLVSWKTDERQKTRVLPRSLPATYQLQQFLEYNITDVDDLYRKTPNTPLVQNQTMNSPNLKEDLVSLKADVLFLKRSVSESDSKFEYCALILT